VGQTLDLRTHSFWRDRETLLIYHHSIGWPLGQYILSEASSRIVIKHHNVTPARFFRPYSAHYVVACDAGQRATEAIALTPNALFWADSHYNAEELLEYGTEPSRCSVQAPFHAIERLAEKAISREVVQACKQYRGTKLLFVGGLKPNKGHAELIELLALYRSSVDEDAVLILPGAFDPQLENYIATLRRLAAQFGVESSVIFAGPVNDSQLRAYYFSADVFLCLSEHEGFCVPLVEAMHFRVPIVTHNCTAIPETVGDSALMWDQHDLASMAESIAICTEHDDDRRALATAGWNRYAEHYSPDCLERRLLSMLGEAFET
jgi:glycosyltransferase involved in cell wall biosynthesis